MPIGIGTGLTLGSATIYLFTDASAMSRGLRQAERDVQNSQKRLDALTKAQGRASTSGADRDSAIARRDLANSKAFVDSQKRVADQVTRTSAVIDSSYQRRSKAIGAFTAVHNREQRAIDASAASLKVYTDAQREAERTLASLRTKSGTLRKGVSEADELIAIEELRRAKERSAKESTRFAAIEARSQEKIAAARKTALREIRSANRAELASIQALEGKLKDHVKVYRDLAVQAGPQYERMVDRIESAGDRLVANEKRIAQARRNNQLARETLSRHAAGGTVSPDELRNAKNSLEQTERVLKSAEATRKAGIRRLKGAERDYTKAFEREADARIRAANRERDRVLSATEAEERARKEAAQHAAARAADALTIATVALAGAVTGAVSQFANFEEALINAAAISPDIDAAFESMKQQILELSVELGKSPTELATALNEVAQAGFEGQEAMDITRVAARAAAAGMTDATTAARPLIGVMNAFADEGIEVEDAANKMFAAVTEGVFSFEDLSTQLGDNISIASALGIELDELLASYVVLTKRSNNLSETTTQLNGIMNSFLKPTQALSAAIEQYSGQTAQAFIQNADFADILLLVNEMFRDNADAAGALFPNIRALRGIFGLTGDEVKEFRKQLVLLEHASDNVGAMQIVLNRQMEGTAFQLRQAKEQFRQIAIEIGGNMAPAVVRLASVLAVMARGFIAINQATRGMAGFLLLGATAIGIMAVATLRLISLVKLLQIHLGTAITRLKAFNAFIQRSVIASRLLSVALSPIGLGLAAIAAVTFIAIRSHRAHQKAVKELKESYERLAKSTDALENRPDLTNAEVQALKDLQTELQNVISEQEKLANFGDREFFVTFGTDPQEALRIQEAIEDQIPDEGQIKRINDAFAAIQSIEDLNVEEASRQIRELFTDFQSDIITAEEFAVGLEAIAAEPTKLTNEFLNASNSMVKFGKTLTTTSEIFGTVDDAADELRQTMVGFIKEAQVAAGAIPDLSSPLAYFNSVTGTTATSLAGMLDHLINIGKIDLTPAQQQAVRVAAEIDRWQTRLDELNGEYDEHNQVIQEWQNRIQTATDLVGSEEDNFASLTDMLNRNKITQQEFNDIKAAAIYLQTQGAAAIDDERVAMAKTLPTMAKYVARHEEANDAYANLTPEAQAFAAAMDDAKTQTVLMVLVMAQLAHAMNPDAFSSEWVEELARRLALTDPLVGQLAADLELLPESVVIELNLENQETASRDIEEINADIEATQKNIDKLKRLRRDASGDAGKNRIDLQIADQEKRLHELEEESWQAEVTITTDVSGDPIPEAVDAGIAATNEALQEIEENFEQAFSSATPDAQEIARQVSEVTGNLIEAAGAVPDFSDPLAYLNDVLGETEFSLEEVLEASGRLGDIELDLDFDQQQAVRVVAALKQTERAIEDLDEQFQDSQGNISEWEERINLVDTLIGTSEDTMAQYEAQLARGEITQQEFNDAVASGEAHRAYAELNQLLEAGLITQEEHDEALKAGIILRDRATRGIFEERAEQVKLLPAMAAMIQLHDRQEASYDNLNASQKAFVGSLADENVQMALQTALMLAQLEAMGALASGTTQRFIDAVSEGNALVGAFFDDIEFDAANISPVIKVQVVEDPEATIDDVKQNAETKVRDAAGNEIVLPIKTEVPTEAVEVPEPDPVEVPVHADTDPIERELQINDVAAQNLAYNTGFNYDFVLGESIKANVAFVIDALQLGPNLALINNIAGAGSLGELTGKAADYGVARGLIDNVGPVNAAARYVALSLYASMVNALLIRSPSKKGEFISEQYLLGVAMGIRNNADMAVYEAQQAAARIDDAFSARLSGGFAAGVPMAGNGTPLGVPTIGGKFASSVNTTRTTSSVSIGAVDIDVNGASGDGQAIAQDVWRELDASFKRLGIQVGSA